MRKLLLAAVLACAGHVAQAADAGKIIFVAGNAQAGEAAAREGAAVQEGQMLSTGADGFIYVKTVDSGLFILRPNTRARIVTYHIDQRNPANTRIKLELLSGVVRSKSGEAVKLARQNFRFNTPVAAIGVRGTDFTVFTDDDTSRVAVISGGVVVSGFTGACRPEGAGPCEGEASRELSAANRGRLVQVQRGQAAAQLVESNTMSPDQVSPPRSDEPLASGGTSAPSVGVEVKKNAGLAPVIEKAVNQPGPGTPTQPGKPTQPEQPTQPEEPAPPVNPVDPVVVVPENPVVLPQLPERAIVWGRWRVVAGLPPDFNLPQAMEQNELLAVKGDYALLRSKGPDAFVAPNNGKIGFQLKASEAFIYTNYSPTFRIETPAQLANGALTVDFSDKSFSTSAELTSGSESFKLHGAGTVGADGRLYGDAANGQAGVMNLEGLLSNQGGGSAAYIFDTRLDEKRTANGTTSWQKKPQ